MILSIRIIGANGTKKNREREGYELRFPLAEDKGPDMAGFGYDGEYEDGDCIEVTTDEPGCFVWMRLDDALGEELVYMTEPVFTFKVPFGEKKTSYPPKCFTGSFHYLSVRRADDAEAYGYRNLCLNVYDHHENTGLYPHSYANVETRGEAVFASRNAINGNRENRSHGEWPYESWGINRNPDAEMTVEFGFEAMIDKIVLYTRADFPHDSWWTSATFVFSDGTKRTVSMEKSTAPHVFMLDPIKTSEIKLCKLIKADDESPFPALTQIEVYGRKIS